MYTDTIQENKKPSHKKSGAKYSKKIWIIAGVALLVLALLAACFWFLSTRQLSMSGKLLGSDGAPLEDGDYQMRVRLFDVVNNSNMVFDKTLEVAVTDAEFTLKIDPPKSALKTPNLAVICLYDVAATDPTSGLLACKDDQAASKPDALVCEPFLVERDALDWNHVLVGDNKLSQTEETAYCEDDPKATYGPHLAISRLAERADITKQDLEEFKQRLESGNFANVTQNYLTEVQSGEGVQSVSGSGAIASTDGQTPVISLIDGASAGQFLQWDGTAWKLATVQSPNTPTSCTATQAICNSGNQLNAALALGTQDNFALNFLTANTPRLTIKENGFVGINTTNPSSRLTVDGNLKITGTDTSLTYTSGGGDKILFNDSGSRSKMAMENDFGLQYYAGNSAAANSGRHVFNVANPSGNGWYERFRISGGGAGTSAAMFSTPVGNTSCTVVTGSGWSCSSDKRLKKDITPIDNGLNVIKALQGVTFLWKDGQGGQQSGFIAQDVEKILPELVTTDAKGYKTLNQNGIVPYLVKAMQEQQREIDQLKQNQQEQQKQIDELKRLIEAIY